MSKLYNKYLELRAKNNDYSTLYLFKSGIFYIFLDKDAKIISSIVNLKLTNLNNTVVKCGFPTSHIDKYLSQIKYAGYNVTIIDNNIETKSSDYILNKELKDFIVNFLSRDIDHLSITEAYELLYETRKIFNKIK